VANQLPTWALLGFLTLPLAVRAGVGAYRQAEEIPKLIPLMALNVLVNLVTPVLVAIGLFLG
jgi:1,4-dihydroxy-2-naphthoate octaprenyltransferase